MKRKIIVFGKGAYWQKKKDYVNKKYEVVAIVDNNKSDRTYDGVPIYSPDEIKQLPKYDILIMTTKKYFFDIIIQLQNLKISDERLVLGSQIPPSFDEGENVLHSLHSRFLIKGEKIILSCDKGEFSFATLAEYAKVIQVLMRESDFFRGEFSKFPLVPLSRNFGTERGPAIDRFYIEEFLEKNRRYITGDILEIADTTYAKKYGHDVKSMTALHVVGWGGADVHIQGNLETGEGIQENTFDCLICTQTIQMIYDIHSVVRNIKKLLRPGGAALITASGISQISRNDYDNWGEFWRFTKMSMQKLFQESFERKNIKVYSWGNVKTSIGFLYGLCQEDLNKEDFMYNDEQYPVIVSALCKK